MEQTNYKNNLKEIRLKKGLTQRQVAALMNMQCESRLSQWENGSAVPSIFNLFRLCQVYRIAAEEAFSIRSEIL
jgi:transcriptional regulator with XRE-family HTH domain